uniref:Uncharacterized protein n=1 Tax=Amphimedon queenslandica TaxID=400682 RepID=A0A1X7U4B5_AMPQE
MSASVVEVEMSRIHFVLMCHQNLWNHISSKYRTILGLCKDHYIHCISLLSIEEICAVSRHSKKEIGRCFKLIRQAANPAMNTVSTTDFMSRYCTNLGFPLLVQFSLRIMAPMPTSVDFLVVLSSERSSSPSISMIYISSSLDTLTVLGSHGCDVILLANDSSLIHLTLHSSSS